MPQVSYEKLKGMMKTLEKARKEMEKQAKETERLRKLNLQLHKGNVLILEKNRKLADLNAKLSEENRRLKDRISSEGIPDIRQDAVGALKSLGLSVSEAKSKIECAYRPGMSVEDLVAAVLN